MSRRWLVRTFITGIKVVEMGTVGPVPHACMLLADMGSDVVHVDRSSAGPPGAPPVPTCGEVTLRGRRNIVVNLKDPDGRATQM
jgi:alpha-methylacyl-CoA racemase